MTEPTENTAKIGINKITLFPEREGMNFSNNSVPVRKSGIIESKINQEESTMPQDTYSKAEIDLKFESLEQKMTHGFKQVDLKFEKLEQKIDFSIQHILSETKNLLLEQQVKERVERENERRTTNRWLVGIAISLAGLIVSIIVNFFLK